MSMYKYECGCRSTTLCMIFLDIHLVSLHASIKASIQGHPYSYPSPGFHLDHWTVCSGGGGKCLCLSLCHCQRVPGEPLVR